MPPHSHTEEDDIPLARWHERDRPIDWSASGVLICRCFGIPEEALRDLMAEKDFADVFDLLDYSMAGQSCGSCLPDIEALFSQRDR